MRYSIKTFLNEEFCCREAIEFHINNKIPFTENIFRMGSKSFFEFFIEAKRMYNENELKNLNESDLEILETDIGEFDLYEGEEVPLDFPLTEEPDVELNKPKRGGSKKYYVYVKMIKETLSRLSLVTRLDLQQR